MALGLAQALFGITSLKLSLWMSVNKIEFRVLNLEEAAVRRSIFEMFVEMDMSIRQIGHKLSMDGIPCPRDARFMVRDSEDEEEAISEDAATLKYRPWLRATISTYLRDVANIGTLVICKKKKVLQEDGSIKGIVHPDQKIIPGAMPPIVSSEMFERAQRKLETNRETKSHRPKNVEDYLLASHVFCALCGNRMRTIAEKGVPVYRCNKHMSIYDTGREPILCVLRRAILIRWYGRIAARYSNALALYRMCLSAASSNLSRTCWKIHEAGR